MKNLLPLVIQNKILLAILAGVVSIGSFQVWQYNQQKHEEFIAGKEQDCKAQLHIGEVTVKQSRNLRNLKYNQVANPDLEQPGINSEFEPGKGYVLIYTNARSLFPANSATYESDFFKSLATADGFAPQPLVVTGVSIDMQKKQALVSSYCSSKPFVVPLENLYETFQTIDINF
ncbi:hypothetical protein [Nostoc sp. CCY0012]|uniref:hypothetical protein n=1 Tax=Nostoc sp. CCY0012 TaxID=1056123 RepID=UPI0039C6AD4B